jgi:O-antigen/teichoic acid export membrane protein
MAAQIAGEDRPPIATGEQMPPAPTDGKLDALTATEAADAAADLDPAAAASISTRSVFAGTRVLAIGVASTGICTFLYLAIASHVLDKAQYSRISLGWSILFITACVIYRPIEQLLSRTIADRAARGDNRGSILRTPALIQAAFAVAFLIAALSLRGPIQGTIFGGSRVSYWVLVIAVIAYAASYFARGWLAGSKRFALYGALILLESVSRTCFAVAVAIGITHGGGAVAAGMAAAPIVSLCVIPFALRKLRSRPESEPPDAAGTATAAVAPAPASQLQAGGDLSLRGGSRFAFSVVAIMLSEQTLINGGVLVIAARTGFDLTTGLAGFAFNVFLVVRAPLQLFQAVQTSILPHLAGMHAQKSGDAFRRTVRLTFLTSLACGVVLALALLALGPFAMKIAVGDHGFSYGRVGLALVGLGVGVHLACGTLNQALLALGKERSTALAWLVSAAVFIALSALPWLGNRLLEVQAGYLIATVVLAVALLIRYRLATGAAGATA